MADLTAFEAPRKTSLWLVEFLIQDGLDTAYRFTDSNAAATDSNGETYIPVPSMEVSLPESTGVLDTRAAVLECPVAASLFFERISNGEPVPPVEVNIREQLATYAGDTPFAGLSFEAWHYSGRMVRTIANAGGRSDSVRIEVVSKKGRMDQPLGMPATAECQNIFRQSPCGADAAAFLLEQNTVVQAINGTVLTTTGLGGPAPTDIYHKGHVRCPDDGVRIAIKSWKTSTAATIQLTRPPPSSWLGRLVRMYPGCVRTSAACAVWGQTANFNGVGIKSPNWHPVFEIPGA